MTSKEDDTLSLPGHSQELSFDVTADEDFIPSSQPQSCSTDSSKIPKNSDTNFSKSVKNVEYSDAVYDSNIPETPPFKAVIEQSTLDWNESVDFIPETETKKTKSSFAIDDYPCKKKLNVFSPGDVSRAQSDPAWNADVSSIPESPALETLNYSILNDFPAKVPSNGETVTKIEESVTEIFVNDSAETVDLETSPVKIEKSESERHEEKLEISSSLNSDVERCEETQIFDNSSVLLLGQPENGSLDLEKTEVSGMTSGRLYLEQTIDDNEGDSQKEVKSFDEKFGPPPVADDLTEKSDPQKDALDQLRPNENSVSKKEVQPNVLPADQTNTSVVTRKIDFKLTVSCFVTFNTKTNKILQKIISNVHEIPKSKPKPAYVENTSDNTSDKSKRYSTSSSGSVYSDKMGLPFALPKRVSAVSDLTDSSEDDFGMLLKEERRALGRTPWSNEYLLPLKMDDIMQISIEKEEFLKRPVISSPRKPKNRNYDGTNHLKEILESSSSEQTLICNLDTQEPIKTVNSEEVLEKEMPENSETLLTENMEKKTDGNSLVKGSENCRKEDETPSEPVIQKLNPESEAKSLDPVQETSGVEGQTSLVEENSSIKFCDGRNRGTDASWKDNAEAPPEFQDFSDDEEENMYKSKQTQDSSKMRSDLMEQKSRKRHFRQTSGVSQPSRFSNPNSQQNAVNFQENFPFSPRPNACSFSSFQASPVPYNPPIIPYNTCLLPRFPGPPHLLPFDCVPFVNQNQNFHRPFYHQRMPHLHQTFGSWERPLCRPFFSSRPPPPPPQPPLPPQSLQLPQPPQSLQLPQPPQPLQLPQSPQPLQLPQLSQPPRPSLPPPLIEKNNRKFGP